MIQRRTIKFLKILEKIFYGVLLIIFSIFIYDLINVFIYGYGEQKYTIGTVVDFKTGGRTPNRLYYSYEVEGKKDTNYIHTSKYFLNKTIKNKKFYVQFTAESPDMSDMFLDYPVIRSSIVAPSEGWDSIPYVGRVTKPIFQMGDETPPLER